ncbi:hypothetical protein K1T71_001776 [Dendrolimus kikuchii]|uniref:Uncharacterized protein n=1 Tax=Dendrolimus kikuchii TaxID=765133 RepID=A0ACC1DG55_9NEOP|nr:hypothetical protein K1T71_001776 [Dendrolimus kikuchii]
MLSYFTAFINKLLGRSNFSEDEDDQEEYLAEQLLNLEISESGTYETETDYTPEIPRDVHCFERTGVVTYIDTNHILIDGRLYFDLSMCSLSLNLNDKVTYLYYKDKNDSVIIVRILTNHGTIWCDENYEENTDESKFKVLEHVIIGEVEYREKRFVFMKDTDLKFSLDDVEGTFIPTKGDWLELKCKVQWDENKPTDISPIQVLTVISFKPVRSKIKTTVVTEWSGQEGLCDKQIYFNKQCIQDGIEPKIRSKVIVEAIESNQGICNWRALKLLIIKSNTTEQSDAPILNIEDTSLKIEREKNIDITYPLKFDKLDFNDTATMMITIKNNGNQPHIINKWIILSKKRDSQINVSPILTRPKRLNPKQTFSFTVTCQPKFFGSSKEHLLIMFRGFQINRFVEIDVVNKDCVNVNLMSKGRIKTYDKIENMKEIRRNDLNLIVPGVKLLKAPSFVPVKLGLFPIPNKVWNAVLGDSTQTVHSSDFYTVINRIESSLPCLTQNLNINNYTDRWHNLLFMEEIQRNIHMRVYDMSNVFLIQCQEYLGIDLNNLSETRPSIIQGDRAVVTDIWNNNTRYEGFVHAIKGGLVLMKFHQRFHESYSGSDVSIEFHFSRSVYRRAHQAINLAISNLGPELLFPTRVLSRPSQLSHERIQSINWFNKNLNIEQKAAVTNIILGESRPLPYLIFGPPGTGKTITVVETILQILTMIPDSRILVATPSNSASNLITERLMQFRDTFSDSMIRLIAFYLTDSGAIPDVIKPYCATMDIARERTVKSKHILKDGINHNCSTSYIGRHRVTIGTCICLGVLAQMGLPKGHFTHIIVDEAGQATEPEIMIPMTFTDKENGQIILAGDPMQLGPVILSKYCVEFSMEESFLSRILSTFPYQKDFEAFKNGFNNKLVTKLNDNYRSLQEVLTLPSTMFYDASLIAKFDRNQPLVNRIRGVVSEIFNLPESKSVGLFVIGIRGSNVRAQDSPSWYNPQEASMVALTACKLYKRNITPNEIGIITPYIAQIKHLKLLFDAMGSAQPKIGTVEEFQGQEKPLIIISTVRSSEAYLLEDQRNVLGFVKCPKRMNVALTRAQVATFLFCDPHLLSTDPLWTKVIKNAVQEEKYMGCDLPLDF